jgi:SAM-dependent methyltransferase
MGLDPEFARLLLDTRSRGVPFTRCLTLGRQNYFVSDSETKALLRRYNLRPEDYPKLFEGGLLRYAEPFWEVLGAQTVDTMDASGFEGASIIHDLNEPISPKLEESFDVVLDGGTVEHVFNVPAAMANCMRMVKIGGRFILFTPANNYMGHGFYQFSPEFFFRTLSEPYGFQVERMIAVEYGPLRRWFEVSDPEKTRGRVALINGFQVLLWVQAKKLASFKGFQPLPKQSDYVSMWQAHQAAPEAGPPMPPAWSSQRLVRFKRKFLDTFPKVARALESAAFSSLNINYAFRNRTNFKRLRK